MQKKIVWLNCFQKNDSKGNYLQQINKFCKFLFWNGERREGYKIFSNSCK